MDRDDAEVPIAKGDHYRHEAGTNEVVYAVEGDVVLTIREYRHHRDFEQAVAEAEYVGVHEGVASLPDVSSLDETDG